MVCNGQAAWTATLPLPPPMHTDALQKLGRLKADCIITDSIVTDGAGSLR